MRLLGILGKFLISVGVGVLLFVVWTLYGTGFYTAQQQQRLSEEFDRLPALERRGDRARPQGPPEDYEPLPAVPVFKLQIPTIDLSTVVVEGVGVEELKLGPGHYPSCRTGFPPPLCTPFDEVFPGEKGRMIVSGHRTTYGQPFWDLDKLRPGDDINIKAQWGDFTYEVTRTEIVPADSLTVVVEGDLDKAELVLTTCNPKFSAAERLVVHAQMRNAA